MANFSILENSVPDGKNGRTGPAIKLTVVKHLPVQDEGDTIAWVPHIDSEIHNTRNAAVSLLVPISSSSWYDAQVPATHTYLHRARPARSRTPTP